MLNVVRSVVTCAGKEGKGMWGLEIGLGSKQLGWLSSVVAGILMCKVVSPLSLSIEFSTFKSLLGFVKSVLCCEFAMSLISVCFWDDTT